MQKWYTIIGITLCTCGLLHVSAMPRMTEIPAGFRDIRDPLLPPDYEQPEVEADPQEQQREAIAAQISWPQLRVRGITHTGGARFFAIIDQIGIVEEDEYINMRQGNLIYTWRVDRITSEGITTTRMHATSVENPNQPIRIMDTSPPAHSQETP